MSEIYPEQVIKMMAIGIASGEKVKPPKTIFLPEKNVARLMIRALVDYAGHDSLKRVLIRFGLEDEEQLN